MKTLMLHAATHNYQAANCSKAATRLEKCYAYKHTHNTHTQHTHKANEAYNLCSKVHFKQLQSKLNKKPQVVPPTPHPSAHSLTTQPCTPLSACTSCPPTSFLPVLQLTLRTFATFQFCVNFKKRDEQPQRKKGSKRKPSKVLSKVLNVG